MIKKRLIIIVILTLLAISSIFIAVKLQQTIPIIVTIIASLVGLIYTSLYTYLLFLSKKIIEYNKVLEDRYAKSNNPDKKLVQLSTDQILQLNKYGVVKDPKSGEIITRNRSSQEEEIGRESKN